MTLLRRLLAVLAWHAAGDPPARVGEAMASVSLYPPQRRRIRATPQRRPSSVGNALGREPSGGTDDRSEY